MTLSPAELAEELEAGRDLHANVDEFAPLLAAALRLAEAVDALATPPEDLNSVPNLIRCHNTAAAAYRAARDTLTRNAP